ncbi:MAG: putative monovalent cation/H+ antiporter subunit B [Methanoregulaceae archaeon PtaU1.Bin222]|nr:MAG: putative monovalent cation/H+ antiporter subunit B [Methanoregulaceae archaeon PtaU1.Bin222]
MKKILTAIIFLVLVAGLCAIPAFLAFGEPAGSDMDQYFIAHGQSEAAANNIVTSIVFDYRGFDTLGESVVLFTAVVGVGLMFRSMKGGNEE